MSFHKDKINFVIHFVSSETYYVLSLLHCSKYMSSNFAVESQPTPML